MKNIYLSIFFIALLGFYYLGVEVNYLVYLCTAGVFAQIIAKFGKGIILLELVMVFSIITYLITGVLGFEVYNNTSKIAVLWVKTMPVSKEQYFDFFFPALIMFFLGLNLKAKTGYDYDSGVFIADRLREIKQKLSGGINTGILLSAVGIIFFFLMPYVKLGYIGVLLYFCLFPGLMYVAFAPVSKVKYFVIGLDLLFIVADAFRTSMFTIIVYMGSTLFSIYFLGRKISILTKVSTLVLALVSLVVIQSVKGLIRQSSAVSGQAIANKLVLQDDGGGISVLTENGFFPMYARIAQGQISAKIMRRYPDVKEFSGGDGIFTSIAAAIVPRSFWPDKPESGGAANMKNYLGVDLKGLLAMNIGPPAEAYANFGPTGGILFMFVFGLLIRFFYVTALKVSKNNALYILWIPVMFFQVLYCMENDVMQALNSVTKGSIFIYLLSKFAPMFFNIKVEEKN